MNSPIKLLQLVLCVFSFHPYIEDFNARRAFCKWMLDELNEESHLTFTILFTDEVTFYSVFKVYQRPKYFQKFYVHEYSENIFIMSINFIRDSRF